MNRPRRPPASAIDTAPSPMAIPAAAAGAAMETNCNFLLYPHSRDSTLRHTDPAIIEDSDETPLCPGPALSLDSARPEARPAQTQTRARGRGGSVPLRIPAP